MKDVGNRLSKHFDSDLTGSIYSCENSFDWLTDEGVDLANSRGQNCLDVIEDGTDNVNCSVSLGDELWVVQMSGAVRDV